MNFKATLDQFSAGKIWYYHVIVPKKISEPLIKETKGRVLCSINGNKGFQIGLLPDGKGNYFINLNQERRNEYGLEIGDELEINIEADNSEYGLPMPEEMQILLDQDEEGNTYFHQLSPGKQRNLLYIVGKPKRSDTRIDKAVKIINYLKRVNGRLDFKELYEALKQSI